MSNRLVYLLLLCTFMIARPAIGQDSGYMVTFPNGEQWQCIVADTWEARANGLRYYEALPENTCMLFIYPLDSRPSFWMPPDMQFSLDIIFVDREAVIIDIFANAPPCPTDRLTDCPTYQPSKKCKYVIEVPAGTAAALALAIGQQVDILQPRQKSQEH